MERHIRVMPNCPARALRVQIVDCHPDQFMQPPAIVKDV
jgi:hypothetical protein